jgi:hypothetical protein
MRLFKATKTFNVPRYTLLDYVKSADFEERLAVSIGRKCAIGNELETELAKYCQLMDERFFGLRRRNIRILSYRFAVKTIRVYSALLHGVREWLGKKLLKNFVRHSQLPFRISQMISLATAKSFTKDKVDALFAPAKVHNVHETEISVVQGTRMNVLSTDGKKQAVGLSCAETGSLTTVVTCMSASGIFVLTLIVFPRARLKPETLNINPCGRVAACHPTGWI